MATYSFSGPVTIDEGDSGSTAVTYFISRTDSIGAATVSLSYGGSAVFGEDYGPTRTVSRSFSDGESFEAFTVNITGDMVVEEDETIEVEIASVTGAGSPVIGVGEITITIANDDEPVVYSLGPAQTVDEGDSGGTTVSFDVTRSDGTGAGAVTLSYSGDATFGAASPADYGPTRPLTVNFASGEISKTVNLTVFGDEDAEADETIGVEITGISGLGTTQIGEAETTITIDDDDSPVTYSLSAPQTAAEGDAGSTIATFTITRTDDDGPATAALSYGGDATFGAASPSDYGPVQPATVDFADGETSKTFDLGVFGDATFEADEVVTIELTGVTSARDTVIGVATTSLTITNDDPPPPVTYALSAAQSAAEGDTGSSTATFTITRDDGDGAATATLSYGGDATFGAASPSDYGPVQPATVDFADGETSKTFDLGIFGDVTVEADEVVTIELTGVTSARATVIGVATTSLTITNDDVVTPDPDPDPDPVPDLSGDDRLVGTAGADTLFGGLGFDTLIGRGDDDLLRGGGGQDVLRGGRGADTLKGGAGKDLLQGKGGPDVMIGGGGGDTLVGAGGGDELNGGRGVDMLTGGAGRDRFLFSEGDRRGTITDFQQGVDDIVLDASVDNFDDLDVRQQGDDVVIVLTGLRIFIEDTHRDDLAAGDFIFT